MLLEVKDLTTTFTTRRGTVRAVDGVSFDIAPRRTVGLVGESGCGKSVTALSIMGLVPSPPGRLERGSILYHRAGGAVDLAHAPSATMRQIRGNEIAMVFQEPMTSLNPVFTIGHQIAESIVVHRGLSNDEADGEVVRLLDDVGIPQPAKTRKRYPHQLSGGMRQRAMIAMALACNPALLIADEPTTALDVTIQAQVLAVMNTVREEYESAILFITHDLGVIARMADVVAVMYLGKIVEQAEVGELFAHPLHPYTRGLMASVPSLVGPKRRRLAPITGTVPARAPKGCVFADRCPEVMERCRQHRPALTDLGGGHTAACFLHSDAVEPEGVEVGG